jgi:predicted dehydrogenase
MLNLREKVVILIAICKLGTQDTHLMSKYAIATIFLMLVALSSPAQTAPRAKAFRIGVAGLTHTHVHWILGRAKQGDIEIVGIAEPNRELAARFLKQHGLSMDLVYNTLEEMLVKTKPEAVTAFNSIYGHLEVVKACAPRGIHVMVEKPLAVSLDHARQMEALAKKHNVYLLTNYETTWYGSNHRAYEMIHGEKAIGNLRKIVVHDGHQGPKEIGVNQEFLEWLTDPVQNGGGALIDFGCYGADLITWLMKGERPLSVTAITQQIKPDVYPKVDDEATIILAYPNMQGVIQASWNWPYARKDMEVYGQTGAIFALDRDQMRVRLNEKEPAQQVNAQPLKSPSNDPFAYLAAVVRGDIREDVLSSLATNMIVVEILEAARKSAKEGKTIYLKGQ